MRKNEGRARDIRDTLVTREELIRKLLVKYGARNEVELMNTLQDQGLVADEAILLADCADRDLIHALLL